MPSKIRILLAATSLCWSGCYTVPETVRTTINLISDEVLISESAQAFDQMKAEALLSYNPADTYRIQRVGSRITAVPGSDAGGTYVGGVVVFEGGPDRVNTFAMPGGKVGVSTGMLKVAENDDQLAVVLGHEIAHVNAQHANEQIFPRDDP